MNFLARSKRNSHRFSDLIMAFENRDSLAEFFMSGSTVAIFFFIEEIQIITNRFSRFDLICESVAIYRKME